MSSPTEPAAVETTDLSHAYGSREALRGLSLRVERGELFALLGPNGSGKTTLFRILSTLVPVQRGEARILGIDVARHPAGVRAAIGVVFQSPSLDKQLTVAENMAQQAALYGVTGSAYRGRRDELLAQLGLADRANELTQTLSGGLRRRVELAKGMIHRPRVLLLDEPSTGLDPGARVDLGDYLCRLRDDFGVSVVLTTHLLEEADKADRIAILSEGSLVALGTPDALRATVGGDSITIETDRPDELAAAIGRRFDFRAGVVDGRVRIEKRDGHQWVARLVEAFPGQIASITLGKPTLEDVFIDKTGHRFWRDGAADKTARPAGGGD